MATIYEVSKLAGVSLATVSRVLNDSSAVRESTRERVHQAMRQLNYQPNAVAKSLASSRSDSIGVLVTELKSPFFTYMMGAIEKELRKHHKHVVVTASHAEAEREREDIQFLVSRSCDALIVHVEGVSDEYLIELCKGPVPVVIVNRYIEEVKEHCIYLDNELGGYLAAKLAIDSGHKDIVYVSGPRNKHDAMSRLEGHNRALEEAGIALDPRRVYTGNYLQTGGWEGYQHFRQQNIDFTTVICGNDEMATGVMSAARDEGLGLPRDLSVIGFDNMLFGNYTFPKLTTIENPIHKMGQMAAQIVMATVYKKTVPDIQNEFEPRIVLRDSVRNL